MAVNHIDIILNTPTESKIYVMNTEHHGKVEPHDHSFYELVYVEKGFTMHICDENNMVLTSGDLFMIVPGQIHAYIGAYHTKIYNCLFLSEAISSELDELCKLPGLIGVFTNDENENEWQKLSLDLNERQQVVKYLEKMHWESIHKPIGWKIRQKSLLVELLVFYARVFNERKSLKIDNPYMQYVYKALGYINENCEGDFMVKDIADYVGISPDYLAKHFKAMLGVSPIEYIKTFRIAKAMEFLSQTDKSITQISKEAGFSDLGYFSRQFKRVTGSSPSMYRRENQ